MKCPIRLFLMTDSSLDRLTGALVRGHYSIEPNYNNGDFLTTSEVSAVFGAVLANKKISSAKEMSEKIHYLLREEKIPYFGFIVVDVASGTVWTGAGWFPPEEEVKPVPAVPAGPYRTSGTVIPFPPQKS